VLWGVSAKACVQGGVMKSKRAYRYRERGGG